MNQHQERLIEDGFADVTRQDGSLPDGYAVLQMDNTYVACSPDGARSAFCSSYDSAHSWAAHGAFQQSRGFPGVGELWGYADRTAIICGNSISDRNTIWVMDWNSGDRADAPVDKLEVRTDRHSLTKEGIIARFSEWTRKGSSDAMWWLAWWFEGTNHPKSVWYYVAALRADSKGYGWAQQRIMSDARSACMCEGVPQPDLAFLKEIPELEGQPIGSDWASAVQMAEQAIHQAAKSQKDRARVVVKQRYRAPAGASE